MSNEISYSLIRQVSESLKECYAPTYEGCYMLLTSPYVRRYLFAYRRKRMGVKKKVREVK